jgi:hypothetical protein
MVLFAVKFRAFFLPSFANLLGENPCWIHHQYRTGVFLRRLGVGGYCYIFSYFSWG